MPRKLTVVISQGQSANPAKRALEEAMVEALLFAPGVEVTVIPHLYDLTVDSTGMLCLSGIGGDMVVASWLFPRAAHWILDRNGIRGRVGPTMLDEELDAEEDDDDDEIDGGEAGDEEKARVVDDRPPPNRTIFCLDLRKHSEPNVYIDEIKRLAESTSTQVVSLSDFTSDLAVTIPAVGQPSSAANGAVELRGGNGDAHAELTRIEEQPSRRWYPVIDYSRCTNCMECIDFCLFGVYGVDKIETILVEQPDNCRKGCPACSRVCPENAIIFPQHKTPAIAGSAEVDAGGLKIDLSKLFGGDSGETAEQAAARERDEQLVLAGRDAVGMAVGMPRRQAERSAVPKDELDQLMDQLDDLNLQRLLDQCARVIDGMGFLLNNATLLGWAFVVSIVMFVGTLLLLPVVVAMLPADYFVRPREAHWPTSVWGWIGLLAKNLLGLVFVVIGIVMLFSPGQGVLTILVGLMLLNFPGKRRLEFWLVRKPHVGRTLNWIRRKAKRPALILTKNHPHQDKSE